MGTQQFIFTSLPREQHAIGVAVMQTMTRLAVPLALGITTAVHTTYDLKSPDHPAANPFTYTFYALLAFGIIGLLLVPFIRIGKQGVLHARPDSPPPSATRSSSDLVDVDFDDEREPGASARQSPSLQSLYETLPRVHPRKSSLYWEK